MKYYVLTLFMGIFLINNSFAQTPPSTRIEQFSNQKVKVWKTIVYPSNKNVLAMHRHEHDRVVVALTDGILKITNNKGDVHFLKLKKDQAYYLSKDVPNELHNDENVSKHPIKVMVIEFVEDD